MMIYRSAILFAMAFFVSGTTYAQFVVLSGGGSPSGNHYSQYLQTKSLTDYLRQSYSSKQVDVAFGAGNRSDVSPLIADVHTTYSNNDGASQISKMIVGNIENNHEATKENVQRMLHSQSHDNRPLFLLVSDHGMPNPLIQDFNKKYSNNCINLWEIDASKKSWRNEEEGCLGVTELESWLSGLKSSRIIYAMSQCYSGGFHAMTVKTNPDSGIVTTNPRICGFTSTTAELTASGCTPNVDGPNYAGYERFFTKQIIGKDFVTNQRTSFGEAKNLYQAHELASLEDYTIDIPLASSDFYLYEVARNLQRFGAKSNFSLMKHSGNEILSLIDLYSLEETSLPNNASISYQVIYNNYKLFVKKTALLLRKTIPQVDQWAQQNLAGLRKQVADIKDSRDQILVLIDALVPEIYPVRDVIKNNWISLVNNNQGRTILGLTTDEDNWERLLINEYGNHSFRNNLIINFSLSYLAIEDDKAENLLAQYLSNRSGKFEKYFESSVDPIFLAKWNKWDELEEQYNQLDDQYRYALRILMYREQLGVLGAAIATNNIKILQNFTSLRNCENTALSTAY